LKSEKIWKLWKFNSEKILKIQKKIVKWYGKYGWNVKFSLFSSIFFLSIHYFLPYFPYLFTIQLGFLYYFSYLFTIQLAFLPHYPYYFTFQITFLPHYMEEK
jgi:polyferredoxin